MKDRLEQFLSAENISQSQFADSIGVARASITHIIAGRNKPSYDFLARMAERYPSLNIEWLLTGRGKMYKTKDAGQILDSREVETDRQTVDEPDSEPSLFPKETALEPEQEKPESSSRAISKVMIFYSDGTYTEIS